MRKILFTIAVVLFASTLAATNANADPVNWEKGLDYYFGTDTTPPDYKAAVIRFRAVGNYAGPNFFLGEIYHDGGYGVEKNEEEAAIYYKRAIAQSKTLAERGDAGFMFRLGYMYQKGLGTEPNQEEAVKWLKKGAEKSNTPCRYYLALAYRDGLGVTQDYGEAIKLFKQASRQGAWGAWRELGHMYRIGMGVERDYAEAMRLYEQAAEEGCKESMFWLGRMYENGNGVQADLNKAIEWYKKNGAEEELQRLGVK